MAEEVKAVEAQAETAQAETKEAAPKFKLNKGIIIACSCVIVVAAAAIGFAIWHNQPSFCSTFCHDVMGEYVDNYYGTDESEGAGLASLHAEQGMTCLDCHQSTLNEQLAELEAYQSGDYESPLFGSDSYYYENDELCLSCHGGSREALAEKTQAFGEYNPHDNVHGYYSCNECHKGHEAQENRCLMCHWTSEYTYTMLS